MRRTARCGRYSRPIAGLEHVAILTREYPPEIYGGAGVHVDYLARALASRVPLTVHAFGADRPDDARPPVRSYRPWEALRSDAPYAAALETMSVDLAFVAGVEGASLVHSHTWYANLAGHLAKLTYDIPHVATVHSLEPLRRGRPSSWAAATRSRATARRPPSKPPTPSSPSRAG